MFQQPWYTQDPDERIIDSFPKAFACTIRPRSKEHGALVTDLNEEEA